MPNRIIKESVCTSPNVDMLSRDAEVFFYRLIVQCDDFGRMDARLPILRAKCYPLQIERVSEADIAAWLNELQSAKLILLYSDGDGGEYLHMQTWNKHQQVRAKRSKYPEPPTDDSNGYQLISDDNISPRNPIQSNPIVIQHDDDDFRGKLIQQWEAVIGMFPTASYPDATAYMDKLQERDALDWWALAITETVDKAKRPSWQYMKAILEGWLAAGQPLTYTNGKSETRTAPKSKPVTHIINPITGQKEAVAQ